MNSFLRKAATTGVVARLPPFCALAQERKWAGRTLDDLEQTIHERLAVLPMHGVFDALRAPFFVPDFCPAFHMSESLSFVSQSYLSALSRRASGHSSRKVLKTRRRRGHPCLVRQLPF